MPNGSVDYKLGELTGQMTDLVGRVDCLEKKNNEDHKEIKKDIQNLNVWRWKIVGGAIAVTFILNFVWNKVMPLLFNS